MLSFCLGPSTHTSVYAEIQTQASGNARVTWCELQWGSWWPDGWKFPFHLQAQGME